MLHILMENTTALLLSIFNRVTGLNFIKKRPQYRCIPVKFGKNLITPCFKEDLRWLLLVINLLMVINVDIFFYFLVAVYKNCSRKQHLVLRTKGDTSSHTD